ncbi:hypothetical protein JOD57_002444 [Geodermatophilus bullaregiensis]|uniref:hypothetical protein n=1 Tax=Geodermatophilus bullaregiensis TaxID=1564160 RepID=UPI00195B3822|nr:hypothetical protein [Geodermatophilus bullaregiensis]MBM7806607.1 hypothetical protein [Geodermatophilus bullaregiensis]
MSGPSDHDRDDDRRPGEAGRPDGWQEPAHLGDGDGVDLTKGGPGTGSGASAWQPPGWDLPPAGDEHRPAEQRPAEHPPAEEPGQPHAGRPVDVGQPQPGGVAWGPRLRPPSVVEQVFRYQGDPVGAQGWALQHGWTVSDGTAPEDAVLAELVATAPVRTTRDHRAAGVMRGRAGALELVAFDVVFVDKRYTVPQYAVTAAPVLLPLPGLRLSPARFWRHRTGGLVPVPSGDEVFDARWVLLAAEDGGAVRRLVADPAVRGLLLGTDDGDEFWAAAGHLAAIRPDGHRPELLEHHARLLGAMVSALAGVA